MVGLLQAKCVDRDLEWPFSALVARREGRAMERRSKDGKRISSG